MLNINTRWADEAESERHLAHTRELYDAFLPSSAGGVYVNFLGDEGEERVRAAYGDARYARLQELKRRYDPDNVFRFNQNIPPAPPASRRARAPAGSRCTRGRSRA